MKWIHSETRGQTLKPGQPVRALPSPSEKQMLTRLNQGSDFVRKIRKFMLTARPLISFEEIPASWSYRALLLLHGILKTAACIFNLKDCAGTHFNSDSHLVWKQ